MSIRSRQRVVEEIALLQKRLSDLFRRAALGRNERSGSSLEIRPKTIVYEDQDKVVLTLELPGVERKDVDVSLYGDLLTVRAERKLHKEEQSSTIRWSECLKGSFVSSFYLPADAEANAIQVEYENWVLRIEVPRKSFLEKKRIPIRSGPASLSVP